MGERATHSRPSAAPTKPRPETPRPWRTWQFVCRTTFPVFRLCPLPSGQYWGSETPYGNLAPRDGDDSLLRALARVRRGKGGHLRTIPVGTSTITAIRGYLPERAQHPAADGPRLWLGERGSTFGYDGLNQALRRRAQHAGIDGFHLHRLRHTAAHRWLAAGGSESGLMAMAGWSRTDMLVRYTRATAADRAAAEALRLDLGNI